MYPIFLDAAEKRTFFQVGASGARHPGSALCTGEEEGRGRSRVHAFGFDTHVVNEGMGKGIYRLKCGKRTGQISIIFDIRLVTDSYSYGQTFGVVTSRQDFPPCLNQTHFDAFNQRSQTKIHKNFEGRLPPQNFFS
ncbi:hypothetical protein TNCV_1715841 [Trichonephila clavipes]|nr:hypothetical protein TNCV_1715841 [Trichonephila clavipes]